MLEQVRNGSGSGFWRSLFPYLLAILLLLLLLAIVHAISVTETAWRTRQREGLLARDAAAQVQGFRHSHTFAAQVQDMSRTLRARLARHLRRSLDRTGVADLRFQRDRFVHLVRQSVPERFRPPGSVLYLFSFDATGRPVCESGPGLTTRKGRFMAGLFGQISRLESLGKSERESAEKACQSVFGGGCPLLVLAEVGKGRPVSCRFEERGGFVLWDTLAVRGRVVGGYFLILPGHVIRTARPLLAALDRMAAQSRLRGVPFLVGMDGIGQPIRVFLPTGVPSRGVRQKIRQWVMPGRRERDIPLATLTRWGDWYLFRDVLKVGSGYEFWVAYPAPSSGRTGSRHRAFLPLAFLTGGLAALILAHLLVFGAPPFISLRLWLPLAIILMGGVPLVVLYDVGIMQIQISRMRETRSLLDGAVSRLEEIDAGHTAIFAQFTAAARRMITDPGWRQMVLGETPALLRRAGERGLEMLAQAGLRARALSILPPVGEAVILSDPKVRLRSVGAMREGFMRSIRDACLSSLGLALPGETGDPVLAAIGRWMSTLGIFMESRDKREEVLFGMIHQGSLAAAVGPPELHFHDILYERGRIHSFVSLIVGADPVLEGRMRHLADHFNASVGPFHWLGVLRRERGELIPVAPHPREKFWRTGFGRTLRRFLVRAAHRESLQVGRIGSHLYVADVCKSTPNLLLGVHVPLQEVEDRAAESLFRLRCLTVLLALFIGLTGTALARFFLVPLEQVQHGLALVGAGDLAIRVRLARDDELGRLTASFDEMIDGLRKRQDLGQFVSGTLEERVSTSAPAGLAEPLTRTGAILVSDVRGFTTMSERHPPEEVVAMLNQHLEEMVEEIRRQGGMIEKFIGDAIVAAFYDAPGGERGLVGALRAATGMRRRHDALQASRRETGWFTYEMGIGIAEGTILSGTVFSAGRLEHVVLGRVRAAAEAMESLSKRGNRTRVVLSPEAARLAQEALPGIDLHPIGFDEGWELGTLRVLAGSPEVSA